MNSHGTNGAVTPSRIIAGARALLCDEKLGPVLRSAFGENHEGVRIVRGAVHRMFKKIEGIANPRSKRKRQ